MNTPTKNIFLLEDDADDADFFETALHEIRPDFTLTVVKHGRSFLEMQMPEPLPCLFVVDMMLPGVSGPECVQHIRKNRQLDEVPVVMLSTHADGFMVEKCLKIGASCYYKKPAVFDEVRSMVDSICRHAV